LVADVALDHSEINETGLFALSLHPLHRRPRPYRRAHQDRKCLSSSLAKEHGNELAPTTETANMPFGLVLAHGRFKFQTRNQLQNL
jgi:hypothetical protein